MKKTFKTFVLITAFSYVILGGISCAGAVVAAVFIPLLGAIWQVKNNSNDKFSFNVKTPNSNTSEFDGEEDLGVAGTPKFTGTFTNHDLDFTYTTVAGSPRKGNYHGYIDDASKVIELTTNSSTLVPLTLIKQ